MPRKVGFSLDIESPSRGHQREGQALALKWKQRFWECGEVLPSQFSLSGPQPEVTSGGAASATAGIWEPWLAYDCSVLLDPDWGPLRKWARLEHVISAGGSLQGGF